MDCPRARVFNLAFGIWPLILYRSFEAVSGPKTDHWLVKTVARAVGRSRPPSEVLVPRRLTAWQRPAVPVSALQQLSSSLICAMSQPAASAVFICSMRPWRPSGLVPGPPILPCRGSSAPQVLLTVPRRDGRAAGRRFHGSLGLGDRKQDGAITGPGVRTVWRLVEAAAHMSYYAADRAAGGPCLGGLLVVADLTPFPSCRKRRGNRATHPCSPVPAVAMSFP